MKPVYYNEWDSYAAQWLRNLVTAGHLPPGEVDERSIEDVDPDDLSGFGQCHFFAGVGGWALALRLAGWPDEREVWTGSCPCQSLSSAGKRRGHDDERHLWPAFFRLISERRPPIIFGEQVASVLGIEWLAAVRLDMEDARYACGAADLPAACVGPPHIRQRLYWVADAHRERHAGERILLRRQATGWVLREASEAPGRGAALELGNADVAGLPGWARELANDDQELPAAERAGCFVDGSPWSEVEWLPCSDGKARPTQPGLQPLAHGLPGRMAVRRSVEKAGTTIQEEHWYSRNGALRGFGNAIVPQVAAAFIDAYLRAAP